VTDQEILESLMISDADGYDLTPVVYETKHCILKLNVPANGALLLKAKKADEKA